MTNKQIEESLKNVGAENIEAYTLINNHGVKFTKKGVKYDLRHWLNLYGTDVDFWKLSSSDKQKFKNDTLPGLLEELKNI